MRAPAERGLEAWMDWAGVPQAEREGLAARALSRMQAECEAIARALDFPLSVETRFSGELPLGVGVDSLYREISDKLGRAPLPFWEGRHPYVVCLTHDIDRIVATYQRLRQGWAALRKLPSDLATGLLPELRERNPYYNFARIRDFQDKHGLRSALYVLFERRRWARALSHAEPQHVLGVYRPRSIARELKSHLQAGGEIGLHASFDSWNDLSTLRSEVRELRSLVGAEVSGCRTHYLQYDPALTPKAESAAGLIYDSSSGFNTGVGFRSGTSFPFRASEDHKSPWELPFQLMDSSVRALRLTRQEQEEVALKILGTVREHHGVLMLNWHFHAMNDEVFPESVGLLRKIIDTAKRDGARFCLPREVAEIWERRKRSAKCASS